MGRGKKLKSAVHVYVSFLLCLSHFLAGKLRFEREREREPGETVQGFGTFGSLMQMGKWSH